MQFTKEELAILEKMVKTAEYRSPKPVQPPGLNRKARRAWASEQRRSK